MSVESSVPEVGVLTMPQTFAKQFFFDMQNDL